MQLGILLVHLKYPAGTNNIPFPIDGPPTPISDPTLNVHNIFPVSLSSAMIIPVGAIGPSCGVPNVFAVYGFPNVVLYPEITIPLVTNGDTLVGRSIGVCHLILPVCISNEVMGPFPMPLLVEFITGSAKESFPFKKKL